MQLRTRTQAILAVVVITATAVAVSLVLATIAIPLTHFKADWHHWFFATFFALILTHADLLRACRACEFPLGADARAP